MLTREFRGRSAGLAPVISARRKLKQKVPDKLKVRVRSIKARLSQNKTEQAQTLLKARGSGE